MKPKWLRRLHVTAHHGHPVTDCPLCARALAERKPWWKRDSPIAQLAVVWLIAITAVVAHFTHTKLSFSQYGGTDKPVTWWIVILWLLAASFATYRYMQTKRRPAKPAELPAEQETTDAE